MLFRSHRDKRNIGLQVIYQWKIRQFVYQLTPKVANLLIAYLVISNCKQIQKYSTDRLQK
jgi:hypothetical protein